MNTKLVRVFAIALILVMALGPVAGAGAAGPPGGADLQPGAFAPGRILVKFQPGAASADKASVHHGLGGKTVEVIEGIGVEIVSVPAGAEEALAAAYARNPLVAYAEPDLVVYAAKRPTPTATTAPTATPTPTPTPTPVPDPYFKDQWALENTGQTGGTPDADIDAPEAWDISKGAGVVIAILDTGMDLDHPDLRSKIVGSADCTSLFRGCRANSPTAADRYGHGTHVAGIAAAVTDNGQGIAGVAPGALLLNVKVLGDDGTGYVSSIAKGLDWAVANGAKVVNMSFAGGPSQTEEDAVNRAWEAGAVLVAAAGNEGTDTPVYPAAYDKCIAVAATDNQDQKASFSNYGAWVKLAAPGEDIISTYPDNTYAWMSGTSMASPHVAGVAALVWANGATDNYAVRFQIESTADHITGTGTSWVYGRVNACKAVGGCSLY
jgi:thermitase